MTHRRGPDLFDTLPERTFGGETYDADRDFIRLTGQLQRTWQVMQDGKWRTLAQVARETSSRRTDGGHDSEASVSARLRDFRKEKFGGHELHRENVSGGLWR